MQKTKKAVFSVLLASVWISLSEFFRNELLFKSYWVEYYEGMGLVFPSEAMNGAIWGLWSLIFATAIYFILQKFSFKEGIFIFWLVGFVLMWVVTGNMGVLPYQILYFAVPLSLLEVFLAALIIKKLN